MIACIGGVCSLIARTCCCVEWPGKEGAREEEKMFDVFEKEESSRDMEEFLPRYGQTSSLRTSK